MLKSTEDYFIVSRFQCVRAKSLVIFRAAVKLKSEFIRKLRFDHKFTGNFFSPSPDECPRILLWLAKVEIRENEKDFRGFRLRSDQLAEFRPTSHVALFPLLYDRCF